MRFGLAGTGPWASIAHGPGLRAAPGVELVGVWGRRPEAAASVAGELGVTSYEEYDALLADVDAVAFALPPDVQAVLAARAADAGKHLLLDKPVAVSPRLATELVAAVDRSGVASVVFFTDLLAPTTREWFRGLRESGPWRGAWGRWLANLHDPANPFGASPWRHEKGGLWDVGPHVVAAMSAALGPVRQVRAVAGDGDVVHLVMSHEHGATSTALLTLDAPSAATGTAVAVWGEPGIVEMPPRSHDAVPDVIGVAAADLVQSARTGVAHPLDVHFGTEVGAVLAEAARQLADADPGGRPGDAPDLGGAPGR